MTTPAPLLPGEAHVWLAQPDALDAPGARERYEALLDAEEKDRMRRFRFERDRDLFLLSHALLRLTLSRYATQDPRDWSFVRNAWGRPELPTGAAQPALRFNLSHTHGLAACAVTRESEIGVDVEGISRGDAGEDIADHYFAPSEVAALQALAPGLRPDRFIEYWTLKEAYIKAHGEGLSLPLADFAFSGLDEGRLAIRFEPRLADDPARWRFILLRPTLAHRAAVAVACATGAMRVRAWLGAPGQPGTPLREEATLARSGDTP